MNPFDVDAYITTAGVVGLAVLMFIETGLLIGVFLPGDSALFTAGVFSAQSRPFAPLWLLLVVVPLAATAGDQLGYAIGRFAGPWALRSRILRWIGDGPVERTRTYFERYGPATIILARFVGVLRSVAPLMAGLSGMSYPAFAVCSLIGSTLWGVALLLIGHFLGAIPLIRDNFEMVILVSLSTLLIPAVAGIIIKSRLRHRTSTPRT